VDDSNVPHSNYAKGCFKPASIEGKMYKFWLISNTSCTQGSHVGTTKNIGGQEKDRKDMKTFTD